MWKLIAQIIYIIINMHIFFNDYTPTQPHYDQF